MAANCFRSTRASIQCNREAGVVDRWRDAKRASGGHVGGGGSERRGDAGRRSEGTQRLTVRGRRTSLSEARRRGRRGEGTKWVRRQKSAIGTGTAFTLCIAASGEQTTRLTRGRCGLGRAGRRAGEGSRPRWRVSGLEQKRFRSVARLGAGCTLFRILPYFGIVPAG